MNVSSNTAEEKGGGMFVDYAVELDLEGSTIDSNEAKNGAGISFANTARLSVDASSSVSGNTAQSSGGGVYFTSAASYKGSTLLLSGKIDDNKVVSGNGGGVYFLNVTPSTKHTVTLSSGSISGNTCSGNGGGIYMFNKTNFTATGSEIEKNSAGNYGGGIYMEGGQSGANRSSFEMNNTSLSENTLTSETATRYGAGVFFGSSITVDLNSGNIDKNTGARYGSGIYTSSSCVVSIKDGMYIRENETFMTNADTYGSGMYLSGSTLDMTGGEISGNTTTYTCNGGGMYLSGGTATITGGEIINNISKGNGGGVYMHTTRLEIGGTAHIASNQTLVNSNGGGVYCYQGQLELYGNCLIENNNGYSGGGVSTTQNCTVEIRENAQISGNTARNVGGGLMNTGVNAQLLMKGGKISDNKASNVGGGLYFENRKTLTKRFRLTGGEISGNSASSGGGVYFARTGGNDSDGKPLPGSSLEISTDMLITGNKAVNYGGGVYVSDCTRLELYEGGRIINNTAQSQGGGIYVSGNAYYYRNYMNAKDATDGKEYSLEVAGGELYGNLANTGRDIYVYESVSNANQYKPPYISAVKASQMDGTPSAAYWIDETNNQNLSTALDNKSKVDAGPSPNYSAYTFNSPEDATAQIQNITYPTVQAAVDAVQSGSAPSSEIILIKSHRETVEIPQDVSVSLDLNGLKLYGEYKSVVTIAQGGSLTLKDSVGGGAVSDGKSTKINNNMYGGGFYVKGTLKMEGGTISSNIARYGEAVYVDGGTFEMSGGVIENNINPSDPSTVMVANGVLKVDGALVRNNQGRAFHLTGSTTAEIKNTTVTGQSTFNAMAVYSACSGGVYIEDCDFENNNSTTNGGVIHIQSNSTVYVKNTLVKNNTSTNGSGIYVDYGRAHLDGVTVTENTASNGGGGVIVGTSGLLYMKDSKIYNNFAGSYANDILLYTNAYYINESGTESDHRSVENFGLDDYNCWLDEISGTIFVNDKNDYAGSSIDYKNVSDEMLNPANDRTRTTVYLTATMAPSDGNVSAEIVDTGVQYPTLASAVHAAAARNDEVTVKLLKDVTEKVSVSPSDADITLDFNGHTVTSPLGTSRVFFINCSKIRFMDSAGGGKLLPPAQSESSDKQPRAIYISGGNLTIDDIEISGFNYKGSGGAIYCEPGASYNSVYYSSQIHIHSGTIKNNKASAQGGAIYLTTQANSRTVFEMTGGTLYGNEANDGGAVYLNCNTVYDYTTITISGGTFEKNSAAGTGGAIKYEGSSSTSAADRMNDMDQITIYGCTFKENSAYNYGAIHFTRAINKNHEFILGDDSVKTVFDGNEAQNEYGVGYIYTDREIATRKGLGIVTKNVELKNNTSGGSNSALGLSCAWISVKDYEVHDNISRGTNSSLNVTAGKLLVEDCSFYSNTARTTCSGLLISSPGAAVSEGDKIVRNCTFHDNTASSGASLWNSCLYSLTIEDCEFYNNLAKDNGTVMLYGYGTRTITFDNVNIHDNRALNYGGAIAGNNFRSATVNIINSTIKSNTSGARGGAIYNETAGTTMIIGEGTVISDNRCTAGSGGGIWSYHQNLIIDGGKITRNYAAGGGGGVLWYSLTAGAYFEIRSGEISENHSTSSGGGLYGSGYIQNSTIESNPPHIELTGGKIINNTSEGNGGGVFFTGGNNTYKPQPRNITGTLIKGNHASGSGGGVYNDNYSSNTIMNGNATITENTAGSCGGGVYTAYARTVFELQSGKLYGNHASLGNDAYISYHSGTRNSNLFLIKASDMFDATENYRGIGWMDESTGAVNTSIIKLRPLGRDYAYTLSYRVANKIVAVYNNTEYETLQDAIDAVTANENMGEVTLVDDTTESVSVPSGTTVRLNLNGHKITGGGTSPITNRGQLIIFDSKKTVTVGENTYSQGDGTGTITGSAAISGGGISIKSGRVEMLSGSVSGCISGGNKDNRSYGGAVAIEGGEFVLRGGTIENNVARYGSAVLVKSSSGVFSMYGGSITNNRSLESGNSAANGAGAVYNFGGAVNIYGGTITQNTAYQGAGIYNYSGRTNVTGTDQGSAPVISDNTAGHSGGGIYVNVGTLTTSNARITDNKTTYAKDASVYAADRLMISSGGGILVYQATANIGDGTVITGNKAVRGGAIYQWRGSVSISGDSTVITNNTAQLGGGCAQSPLPGNNSTVMTLSDGASVYGNKSTRTAAGNDFYSAWEGTNTYNQQLGNSAQNTPMLNLIAAASMHAGNLYNVWKNDNYSGTSRTGTDLVSGQFVTAEVNLGNNIQITAAYYKTDVASMLDSDFAIKSLSVQSITDGTKYFDNGTRESGVFLADSSAEEKTAKMLLDEGLAEYADETYTINSEAKHYIRYGGKLYQQNQAVSWQSGNDSSEFNHIVRSYDTIAYKLGYSFEGDPKQTEYTRDYNCQIKLRVTLKGDVDQAVLSAPDLMNKSTVTSVDEHGQTVQIMTGYWKKVLTPTIIASGTLEDNVIIEVKGMSDGTLIEPKFEMWFVGNDRSPHGLCGAEIVTVSAAPKYNVAVRNNPRLLHTGYFDVKTKCEVGDTEKDNPDVVYGTMLGFGATVELYNDPAVKGMKGIELPADGLEFDLSFNGNLYNSNQEIINDAADAPILWAYKENNTSIYGRDFSNSVDVINMSWDDEDNSTKDSHYAYDSAPYNTGSTNQSCYDGGGWTITPSAEAAAPKETKLHVNVNGYKFNSDGTPTCNAGNSSADPVLNSSAVKAFSAGYVQMILPLNNIDELHHEAGYYQIYMEAAVSKLNVRSVTGKVPENVSSSSDLNTPEKVKQDLDGMNEYFKYPDSQQLKTDGLAVNERRYYDNQANVIQAMTVANGGSGNVLGKYNIFNNYDNSKHINGTGINDNGKGDTPLNSTVFIEGTAYFASETINTSDENSPHYALTDPYYNSETFNILEFNYMTGLNILQKFDADAYTPLGTQAIINEPSGSALDEKLGENFRIITDESATSWSSDITRSYKLTILYAAKPDKSNWVQKYSTDNSVSPPITYSDGGAEDMDKYREENLMYFRTLDELHDYLGSSAKCVAILYQFRECLIRTDHSVSACAKMEVIGDFDKVGDTYCTTNDVRCWYTFRPYYKMYYSDHTVEENTYSFNWINMQHNPDEQTTDPTRDDYVPPCYGAVMDSGSFFDGDTPVRPEEIWAAYSVNDRFGIGLGEYTKHYVKSRYRNGNKLGGTHNGMDKGNCLLLYSIATNVEINVETKEPGTNRVKSDYTITLGERNVQYRVTPHVSVASGANKTTLIRNGTQSADIMLTITIPQGLNYQEGSVYVDYSYAGCDYSEGDMNWQVESRQEDGKTYVYLKTFVSDIDKGMPEIFFDCTIGDENDPSRDIQTSGTSLVVNAEIDAEYSESSLLAAQTKMDTAEITVLLTAQEGISKSVESKLVEIGEDMVYSLTYANSLTGPTYKIEAADILPHNGDGRETNFTGGYRVKKVRLEFTTAVDCSEFINSGALGFGADNEVWMSNYEKSTYAALLNEAITRAKNNLLSTTYSVIDEKTLEYDFTTMDIGADALDASDEQVKSAPEFFAYIPQISGESRFTAKITVSARVSGTNSLIESGTGQQKPKTQVGGNEYHNCFAYRKLGNDDNPGAPLVSNSVSISTVNRVVSGTVFIDTDQDGLYNSPEWIEYYNDPANRPEGTNEQTPEYPLEKIKVTLYKVGDSGELSTAKNILGAEVLPQYTDSKGFYFFENLPAGEFTVKFTDEAGQYKYKSPEYTSEEPGAPVRPLPFDKLSVTSSLNSQASRGNKCAGTYDTSDKTKLESAQLDNVTITLPEISRIPTVLYSSPDWNLGLYYQDITVEKQWENMIYGIPDDSEIEFTVKGKSTQSGNGDDIYSGKLVMTNASGTVVGTYTEEGKEPVTKTIAVTEDPDRHIYITGI